MKAPQVGNLCVWNCRDDLIPAKTHSYNSYWYKSSRDCLRLANLVLLYDFLSLAADPCV